jgi:cation diffusion facilitator family transporter
VTSAPDAPVPPTADAARREKQRVALSSVIAAVFLTAMKLAVGLWTGSLGILAEAVHSGLDLAAAGLTLVAVRFAGRSADESHPYGHGKIENLAALAETLLLVGTCAWIVWEAVHRLAGSADAHVDANVWAFLVIGVSIAVDVSRSRALRRVARKYRSQALEADALHFSTDVLSSAVVLLGLLGVVLADAWGMPSLGMTDAIAALGVAAIAVGLSWRLGRKAVDDLLDSVPPGLNEAVGESVRRVFGVLAVRRVRVRRSGPETFADVTIAVPQAAAFEQVHAVTDGVEEAVRALLPRADVVVHAEPVASEPEDLPSAVRRLAARQGLVAHDIRMVDEGGGRCSLDLHLEMDKTLSVGEAHAQAEAFERAARDAFPAVVRITTHLEPAGGAAQRTPTLPGDDRLIREAVEASARELGFSPQTHDIEVMRSGGELTVTFHCLVDAAKAIDEAHDLTMRLEQAIRARAPGITRVVIHVEPEA